MNCDKEQIKGSEILNMGVEADAYKLVDCIYSFIARCDIFHADALNLALNTISAELSKGIFDEDSKELMQSVFRFLYIKSGR